jgi:hypothetical protein
MKEIRKNDDDARAEMGKTHLSFLKCDGKSALEEMELMFDKIHKRATEVGPVLEGILHIHCEGSEPLRLWN